MPSGSAKKLCAQKGSLSCVFNFQFWGCRGSVCRFSRSPVQFRFCFFKFLSDNKNAVQLAAESK